MPVDADTKLQILGGSDAAFDADDPSLIPHFHQMRQAPAAAGVCYAAMGGGRRLPLLRALRTNVCELSCRYCSINAYRDVRRASFKPEELARTFMDMYRRNLVAGLFLSSGVAGGPARAAEKMIEAVEIIREGQRFRGYIHLKIMPGQPPDYIERAVQLADRVSINLEAPTPDQLARIAPKKDYWRDLVSGMEEVRRLQGRYPDRLRAGQITQMVVGAAGDSDADILKTSQ